MLFSFYAVLTAFYSVLVLLRAVANSLYAMLFQLCTEVKSLYAVPFSCKAFFPLYAVLLSLCAVAFSLYAVLFYIYIANSSQFLFHLMFYGHAIFKGNSQKEARCLSSPVYRCRVDQIVKNHAGLK